jgi:hypothetical protein
MEVTKLTNGIVSIKLHGDAVRIASIVNSRRMENGLKKISPAYVRSMLNGQRKITDEVAEIASRYYEAQSAIMN